MTERFYQEDFMELKNKFKRTFTAVIVTGIFMAGAAFSEESSILSAKGQRAFNGGNYSEAMKYFTDALANDPGNPELLVWQGICYSRQGNYEKAIEALSKAGDAPAVAETRDFETGYACYMLEKYSDAENAFLSALKRNPSHNASKYFLGRVYLDSSDNRKAIDTFSGVTGNYQSDALYYSGVASYNMNEKEPAKNKFNAYLESEGKTAELSARAESYLKDLEGKGRSAKKWNVNARGYMEYDDNVILVDPDSKKAAAEEAKDFGFLIEFPPTDDNDWRYVYRVRGSYYPYMSENSRFDLTASVYNSTHIDLSEYDLNHTTVGTGYRFFAGAFSGAIRYDAAYSILDGKDYKRSHTPSAEFSYKWEKLTLSLSHRYSDEHFFRYNNSFLLAQRRGHVHRSELTALFEFSKNLSVWGGYEYAVFSSSPYFDADMNTLEAGLSVKFLERHNLIFRTSYYEKDYDSPASDFWHSYLGQVGLMTERDDDNLRLGIEYIARINDSLSFSAGYSHTDNDSNHVLSDYDRNVVNLGIILNR